MTEKFVTKRPHKKSRAGCQTCKTRKIKCDEAQPACSFCAQRNLQCCYVRKIKTEPDSSTDFNRLVVQRKGSSTSSESDVEELGNLSVVPGAMPMLSPLDPADLRTMHHWSTVTWKSIGIGSPGMDSIFESVLPYLAFENDFLMNGILGIASLHMQRMLPDPTLARQQTSLYRAKSFSGFRDALTRLDPQGNSYEAALLMSVMIVILTSKDYSDDGELTIIRWLGLYQGLGTIMNLRTYPNVMETSVAPVFQRELTILQTIPVIPTVLMDMVASIDVCDPEFGALESYCATLDAMAKLFASLREDGLTVPLFVRLVSWASWLNEEFVGYAKERRPRALVILAWYLAFLKLLKGCWWIEGMSDPEIEAISKSLGPEWQVYLDVPLKVRETDDSVEIATLLLQ